MRAVILWLAHVLFNWRGPNCKCGFSEAAHFDHKLEWDMDNYPCDKFTPMRKGETK